MKFTTTNPTQENILRMLLRSQEKFLRSITKSNKALIEQLKESLLEESQHRENELLLLKTISKDLHHVVNSMPSQSYVEKIHNTLRGLTSQHLGALVVAIADKKNWYEVKHGKVAAEAHKALNGSAPKDL